MSSLGLETDQPPGRSVVEYPLSSGKLVLTLHGNPPEWAEPVLKTLGQLLTLRRGWNSYGAKAIEPTNVWAAWQLLTAILRDDSPVPAVVPTSRGGIQAEWHLHGKDLEIEVISPQRFSVSFEDATTGEMWEKEMTQDLDELAACVARLTSTETEKNGASHAS